MNRLDYLYDKEKKLKQLIDNRNNLIGYYDNETEYEVELCEVQQEIFEKEGF